MEARPEVARICFDKKPDHEYHIQMVGNSKCSTQDEALETFVALTGCDQFARVLADPYQLDSPEDRKAKAQTWLWSFLNRKDKLAP